jgi:hypothetical protein
MHEDTAPAWGWRDVGGVIVLLAGVTLGLFVLVRALRGWMGAAAEATLVSPLVYAATALIYLLLLLGIYLFAARRAGWAALGLRGDVWGALRLTPLLLLLVLVGMMLINSVIIQLSGSFDNPQVDSLTGGEPLSRFELLALLVLVAGLVPFAEELFFRGMVYPLLRYQLGVALAVVLSAALFAAFHVVPLLMPALFFVGLVLGALRAWSGSLVPCIALHAMQNGVVLLVFQAQLMLG